MFIVSNLTYFQEIIDWTIGEENRLSENEIELPVVIQYKQTELSEDKKFQDTRYNIDYHVKLRCEDEKWYICPDSFVDGELVKKEVVQHKEFTRKDQAKSITERFFEAWKENDIEKMYAFAPSSWQKINDIETMQDMFGGRQLVEWELGEVTESDDEMTVSVTLHFTEGTSCYNAHSVSENIFWRMDMESFRQK